VAAILNKSNIKVTLHHRYYLDVVSCTADRISQGSFASALDDLFQQAWLTATPRTCGTDC